MSASADHPHARTNPWQHVHDWFHATRVGECAWCEAAAREGKR